MSTETKYKIVNGTHYHHETPDELIAALEFARKSKLRIRMSLGNKDTGRDWLESEDVTGWISRSCGPVKAPILLAKRSSTGGPAILDHCIVFLRTPHNILWMHPKYHYGCVTLHKITPIVTPARHGEPQESLEWEIRRDGEAYFRFATRQDAERFSRKLGVEMSFSEGA